METNMKEYICVTEPPCRTAEINTTCKSTILQLNNKRKPSAYSQRHRIQFLRKNLSKLVIPQESSPTKSAPGLKTAFSPSSAPIPSLTPSRTDCLEFAAGRVIQGTESCRRCLGVLSFWPYMPSSGGDRNDSLSFTVGDWSSEMWVACPGSHRKPALIPNRSVAVSHSGQGPHGWNSGSIFGKRGLLLSFTQKMKNQIT